MLLTETRWHVFYISKLPSLSFKETSSSLTTCLLTGKAPEIRHGGLISLFLHRRIYTPESPSKEKWSRQSQPVVERVFKSFTSVKILIPHCKKKTAIKMFNILVTTWVWLFLYSRYSQWWTKLLVIFLISTFIFWFVKYLKIRRIHRDTFTFVLLCVTAVSNLRRIHFSI